MGSCCSRRWIATTRVGLRFLPSSLLMLRRPPILKMDEPFAECGACGLWMQGSDLFEVETLVDGMKVAFECDCGMHVVVFCSFAEWVTFKADEALVLRQLLDDVSLEDMLGAWDDQEQVAPWSIPVEGVV